MAKKKNSKPLTKLDGGGNDALTKSRRMHPTYKPPALKLIKK